MNASTPFPSLCPLLVSLELSHPLPPAATWRQWEGRTVCAPSSAHLPVHSFCSFGAQSLGRTEWRVCCVQGVESASLHMASHIISPLSPLYPLAVYPRPQTSPGHRMALQNSEQLPPTPSQTDRHNIDLQTHGSVIIHGNNLKCSGDEHSSGSAGLVLIPALPLSSASCL